MVYTDTGLLAYEARFERCEINCDLVAGFVTAINQFGCELFPENTLCDILFSDTHMLMEPRPIGDSTVTFLIIHDTFEDHDQIYRIIDKIHEELKKNYASVFGKDSVNRGALAPLDEFIVKLFENENRPENPFTCVYDD